MGECIEHRRGKLLVALAAATLLTTIASAHDAHGIAAPTPDGGLPWHVLQGTQAVEWHDPQTSRSHLRPEYSPEVRAYDRHEVKVAGYMMATDDSSARQSRFILFEYQPDCLFHMSMGPTGFIEVQVDQPVPVTEGPMIVEGRLQLVNEAKGGIFYRIEHGRVSAL